MCRSTFISVIKIITVGGGAVTKRCHAYGSPIGLTYHRTRARLVGRRARGLHEIAIAGRDANARDIDQQ
jgi:hypothetical protein